MRPASDVGVVKMAKCKDCEYYMNSGLCEYNECYARPDFNSCDAYIPKEDKLEEEPAE